MSQHPDASRCLLCRKPLCSAACPVRTPVPEAMKLYREGRLEEAGKLLFDNNPFSAISCQVCDWQRFCFGHCVLNAKKIPIAWYKIEQEISMEYLMHASITPGRDTGKKVSVVGAGPAGIAAALMLRQKGVAVTVYDPFPRAGGVLRYGIPSFRLDKKYVDRIEELLLDCGTTLRMGVRVGSDIPLSRLRAESVAVLIAAGAWVPRKLDVPGEDNPDIIYALDYLADPSAFKLGRRVFVVGGGNVTMDASRTAARLGHNTTVLYRKTFENMPASYNEIEGARLDGVKFMVFQVPVGFRVEDGRNIAIIRDCENYHREDGSIATRMIEGSDHELEFDTMIVAISEKIDKGILGGGKLEEMEDVVIAGDYELGPATVVEAVASARRAVLRIEQLIQ